MAPPVDGVLLVDKPEGLGSTQALGAARRALAIRKAGHTGTLDPFATGLLPLVFGEATKFSRFLLDADKRYLATLRLGATSTTGDTEGEISEIGVFSVTLSDVEPVLASLRGAQSQIPPMHSAVRVEGRRLYDLARQGVEIPRAPRDILIHELESVSISDEKLVIAVKCSKGTYVRTLGEEIGRRLGCGAYLTGLRRTAIGALSVDDAIGLADLAALGPDAARERLLPTGILVAGLPRIDLSARDSWAIRNGQVLVAPGGAPSADCALFDPEGAFIGVGTVASGRLSASRLLNTGHG